MQQFYIKQCILLIDVNVDFPDEKSIITYVSAYYHYFAKMKTVEVSGSRVGKVKLDIISLLFIAFELNNFTTYCRLLKEFVKMKHLLLSMRNWLQIFLNGLK